MNPYEKFKVEVELPLSRARYVVEGDDDIEFIFEQYKRFGKQVIRVYVEVIPMDFVEPITLLEAQPEDNEDHGSGQDGQRSGVGEGIETGQESGVDIGHGNGVVKGIEIGQRSGGVKGNQYGQGSGGVEDIEVRGEMFEYHEYNSYEGSTNDEDAVTRVSKHMKGQQFAYEDNEKIHFKVGQVFEEVDHFRKAMEKVKAVDREAHRWMIENDMQARAKVKNDWVTTVPPTVHKKINGLIEPARNVEAI
ncbi:hypothetical protein Pint_05056 [Pistacia integerrima]|uniref:Uncharacterized protein n=1 Tax=Pistacia integerrima TaxID=434235 RepID=A0ACC0Z402_9ROSI|nr:hypothetical protein Pint_05056 [Pistacia integerrima]